MGKASNVSERFKTHANYLRAFARLVPKDASTGSLAPLRERFKTLSPTGGSCTSAEAAMHSLKMSWRTELILDFTSEAFEDDELVRVANNWAVVQVYYILYHSTQALAQAKGQPRTPNHQQTQKTFTAHWADRTIQLPPWSLSRAGEMVRNWPPQVPLVEVHPWAACDDAGSWQLAAKALRTTREMMVAESLRKRREELHRERRKLWELAEAARMTAGKKPRKHPLALPQLTAQQRAEVEARVRATTMMDYIYRLRIGTNYQDSAVFTDGPEEAEHSTEVRKNLSTIAAATMLVHELAVADLVGPGEVVKQAQAFLASTAPQGAQTGLRKRMPLIEAHRQ